MRRASILLIVLAFLNLSQTPLYAIGDAASVYTWSSDGIDLAITLENKSRPTLINGSGLKQPVFLKGDRVRFEIEFSVDRTNPVWEAAKEDVASKYPNEKTIELDADVHLSLMSGNVELFEPILFYDYLTDTYSTIQDGEGEFTMGASTELIINQLTVSLTWASEDSNGDVEADQFKYWELIKPSKANPFYLYNFTNKIPQYLSYPIMPKLGLQHGSVKVPIISTSGLPVQVTSLSPQVCKTQSSFAIFLKAGSCKLLLQQQGNSIYAAARESVITFPIVKSTPTSIVCGNFFRMIEVPGKKAKCPTGFKQG